MFKKSNGVMLNIMNGILLLMLISSLSVASSVIVYNNTDTDLEITSLFFIFHTLYVFIALI